MLDLREADVTQTRFYREVRDIGQQEEEANLIVRLLSRRFGALSPEQISQVRSLSIPQLESLAEALLDFQHIGEFEAWLQANSFKVVGASDPHSLAVATLFYEQTIETVVPVSSAKAAELVKVFENTFRAVNIALVNELALLCDRLNLNVWEVLDAANTKPFDQTY